MEMKDSKITKYINFLTIYFIYYKMYHNIVS